MHARDLRLLLYFAEIVQNGSIRGAARALSVSPPVVSQALSDLEAIIGTTLIRRTTRRLILTQAGTAVHAEALAMARHAGTAMTVAATDRPLSGTLRLSVPVELASTWLPSRLKAYRALHPDVELFIEARDTPINPAGSQIDLAIRATFQMTRAKAIAQGPAPIDVLPIDLVCAADLDPGSGDLDARLDRIGYIGATGDAETTLNAIAPDGSDATVKIRAKIASDDRLTVLALARQGFGAALLIRETVAGDLANGSLQRAAPDLDVGFVAVRALATDPAPDPVVLAFIRLASDLSPLRTPDPTPDSPSATAAPSVPMAGSQS